MISLKPRLFLPSHLPVVTDIPKKMSQLDQYATDLTYAAGWSIIKFLPDFITQIGFDTAIQHFIQPSIKQQLQKNLARILSLPPNQVPSEAIRASLVSYGRYWREAFQLPSMNIDTLMTTLDNSVEGKTYLDTALQAGKGVILALPHSGNWDMAGVWLVRTHGGFTTVAERVKPESLYRRFVNYREKLGFEVLPLSGTSSPFPTLVQRLTNNQIVCLVAERDLTHSGITVNFFDEPAQLPSGPARLAVHTGATLLSVHCWFTDHGWGMRVDPPVDTTSGDITTITQLLADRFTHNIAQHPYDWHMLQPQWLADLSPERRARLASH